MRTSKQRRILESFGDSRFRPFFVNVQFESSIGGFGSGGSTMRWGRSAEEAEGEYRLWWESNPRAPKIATLKAVELPGTDEEITNWLKANQKIPNLARDIKYSGNPNAEEVSDRLMALYNEMWDVVGDFMSHRAS